MPEQPDPIDELCDLGEALCDIESQPGWREHPGLVAQSGRLGERRRQLRKELRRALEEGGEGE